MDLCKAGELEGDPNPDLNQTPTLTLALTLTLSLTLTLTLLGESGGTSLMISQASTMDLCKAGELGELTLTLALTLILTLL